MWPWFCREAGRTDEAIQCYTICIQLQFRAPTNPAVARAVAANPQAAAAQQAQRLSVAYNNLGGILKLQVRCLQHIGRCVKNFESAEWGTSTCNVGCMQQQVDVYSEQV